MPGAPRGNQNAAKPKSERVQRVSFSFYPAEKTLLTQLAEAAGLNRTEYLRQLIEREAARLNLTPQS
jgi:hypothetical protein